MDDNVIYRTLLWIPAAWGFREECVTEHVNGFVTCRRRLKTETQVHVDQVQPLSIHVIHSIAKYNKSNKYPHIIQVFYKIRYQLESSSTLWLCYLLYSYNSCKPEMLLHTCIKNINSKCTVAHVCTVFKMYMALCECKHWCSICRQLTIDGPFELVNKLKKVPIENWTFWMPTDREYKPQW